VSLATAVYKLGINIEMFVSKIMSCCLSYSKMKLVKRNSVTTFLC